jgi:hypothetical protein
MTENENPLTNLSEVVRKIQSAFAAIADGVKPVLDGIAVVIDVNKRLGKIGWLPHHTTPFKLVLETEPDKLAGRLEEYYGREWDQVRDSILARLDRYEIDPEAKATFREALNAHGHGFYRSSCRVLFPEIERVLWVEVHAADWKKRITSQKEFIALVNRFPAGITLTDPWAYELYQKLSDHIYVEAKESNQQRFQSIPNRHAAVHGRIIYSSLKHSMNTIILADYVFAVLSAAKRVAKSRTQPQTQ